MIYSPFLRFSEVVVSSFVNYIVLEKGVTLMLLNLLRRNRSYRRFEGQVSIQKDQLTEMVEAARLSASGGNRQPLKFFLANTEEENRKIFPCLSWAGGIQDWSGPAEGNRPTGYIIILGDTGVSKNFGCDHCIAAESILLKATEDGLGGCMMSNVDRAELRSRLKIPERYEILLVVALGKPSGKVVLEDSSKTNSTDYWLDGEGLHHVPKRPLDQLIIEGFND